MLFISFFLFSGDNNILLVNSSTSLWRPTVLCGFILATVKAQTLMLLGVWTGVDQILMQACSCSGAAMGKIIMFANRDIANNVHSPTKGMIQHCIVLYYADHCQHCMMLSKHLTCGLSPSLSLIWSVRPSPMSTVVIKIIGLSP